MVVYTLGRSEPVEDEQGERGENPAGLLRATLALRQPRIMQPGVVLPMLQAAGAQGQPVLAGWLKVNHGSRVDPRLVLREHAGPCGRLWREVLRRARPATRGRHRPVHAHVLLH